MNIRKYIDEFQIIGFVFSIAISLLLLFTKEDTLASISLGLILAIITQLFDLQFRQNALEERIMEAEGLSKLLFQEEWLFTNISLSFVQPVAESWKTA